MEELWRKEEQKAMMNVCLMKSKVSAKKQKEKRNVNESKTLSLAGYSRQRGETFFLSARCVVSTPI